MRDGWRMFLISAAVLFVLLALEQLWVPGIVPVAFADEPQPLWAVEAAFVLRALEFLAGGVALVSLVLSLAAWMRRRLYG